MAVAQETLRGRTPAEALSALPIIEQFRQGHIGRGRLIKKTVPLSQFFGDHNLVPNTKLFSRLYDRLNTSPVIIRIKSVTRSGAKGYKYDYRVDPSFADTLLPQLQTQVQAVLQELYPPRTPEEKTQAQRQLLRVRQFGGSHEYSPITLEETFDRLRRKALHYFSSLPDPSELADTAIAAVVPYLQGERGNFADFATFIRFFMRVLKSKKVDWFHSSQRREVHIDPQSHEGEVIFQSASHPEETTEEENKEEREALKALLGKLSPEDAKLLERKFIKGLSYEDIARIDERGRSIGALRVAAMRAKDRLLPSRRKQHPVTSIDELIQLYRTFRNGFLERTGRLPNSEDVNRARKNNQTRYSRGPYLSRFGGGSWSKAQVELERLIKDSSE